MAKQDKNQSQTENIQQAPTIPEESAVKKSAFSLERLRTDCYKLFGVTTSTFDGATYGLDGIYTVDEIRKIIQDWQKTPVFRKQRKEGK